jgi:hypothetical protein
VLSKTNKGPFRPAVKTLLTADLHYNQGWFRWPVNLLSDLSLSPRGSFSVNGFFRRFASVRQSQRDLHWPHKAMCHRLVASCDYAVLYLIPKAFNNLGSILPVTGNPCAAWNARIP